MSLRNFYFESRVSQDFQRRTRRFRMKIIVECVRPQNNFPRLIRRWLRLAIDLLFEAGNLIPPSPLLKTDASKPGKLPLLLQPQHFPDQVREPRSAPKKVSRSGRIRTT